MTENDELHNEHNHEHDCDCGHDHEHDCDCGHDHGEYEEVPLSEDIQKVLFYALDEATSKIESGEDMIPFTVAMAGEDLFMDEHPGEDVEACFASAADSINLIAHLADAYVFCYDGYVETDEGDLDMIIAEVGLKGEPDATAYGLAYQLSEDGEEVEYDEAIVDLGPVDSLFDPERVADAEALQAAYQAAEADDEDADDEDADA